MNTKNQPPILSSVKLKIWQLNLLISLLFVTAYNIYFWQDLLTILQPESLTDYAFIASIFLLLVLVINMVLTVLISEKFYKFSYALLFILSAICFYYILQYNIIIDKDMIRNVMETNPSEAKDLLSLRLFIYLILMAVLPTILMAKISLHHQRIYQRLWGQIKIVGSSLLAISMLLYVSYPSYASLARNNHQLSHLILPTNFIFAGISYAGEQFKSAQQPFQDISASATQNKSFNNNKKVVVMIIGETARADRFSINGYDRETNPKLKHRQLVNFNQTFSCGTSTATSLPCLFSNLDRLHYSHKTAVNSANLLDFFEHVGIKVQWRDNNTGCKGICARSEYHDLAKASDSTLCPDGECYDEILLQGLAEQINTETNDQVIILHQKGSHGPAYFRRYPSEFEAFKPTCQSVQLQDCSQSELNNSYDNTIVYTDYFIDKTMQLLEGLPKNTETSLIYIADHGESLGENNLYLHGTPYMIAPEAQKHVPFIFWQPASQIATAQVDMNCLKNNQNHPFSHDNIFHSMLGYFNINSPYYQANLDLFSDCQTLNKTHLAATFNPSTLH